MFRQLMSSGTHAVLVSYVLGMFEGIVDAACLCYSGVRDTSHTLANGQ